MPRQIRSPEFRAVEAEIREKDRAEIERLHNGLNNIATTEVLRTVDEIKAYARTIAGGGRG